MRDINKIVTKLGVRVKEINNLVDELPQIVKSSFGDA